MADKTIMIIGAGFGQVPAIQEAKAMSCRVVAVDKNPEALGMVEADIALPLDVVDSEGIIAAAKEHAIDAVFTMQTNLPVPIVGNVVDALGLKGNGYEIAERCSNKIETRYRFAKAGVPQPDFRVAEMQEAVQAAVKEIGFPCIVKPPDSSGSRGVVKVNSASEVPAAYDEAMKYSRIGKLLIEEYIPGIEIGAQAFSVDGKCVKVLIHDDTVSDPPYMVPTGHIFPSVLSKEVVRKTEEAVALSIEALGIHTGPSNVDLILNEKNEALIIEIGARIGATCLPELVYYYTGINWVKQSLLASLGQEVDLTPVKEQATAAVILEAPVSGVFRGYEMPDGLLETDGLLEFEITAREGETVHTLTKGTDRIGKVVVQADTPEEALKTAESIKAQVIFKIDT